MLIDKNGREITAGCKVLWGDTLTGVVDGVKVSLTKQATEVK